MTVIPFNNPLAALTPEQITDLQARVPCVQVHPNGTVNFWRIKPSGCPNKDFHYGGWLFRVAYDWACEHHFPELLDLIMSPENSINTDAEFNADLGYYASAKRS